MEIHRGNFDQSLPNIKKAIKECCFMSFDAEFSGLADSLKQIIDVQDQTPEMAYQQIKARVGGHNIIQFGLSTFHRDSHSGTYFAKTFNFHIFPTPSARNILSKSFIAQPSAIKFLCEQNFDFNMLFYQGVSYLSKSDEMVMEKILTEKAEGRLGNIEVDARGKNFLDITMTEIDSWYTNKKYVDSPVLNLNPPNAYCRRLLYQRLRNNYDKKLMAFGTRQGMQVELYDQARVARDQKYKSDRVKSEMSTMVAFRKVIDAMTESKKPVIGHNVMLDLCHVVNQFLVNPLPESLADFKTCMDENFPNVFDTKYMYDSGYNEFTDIAQDSSLGAIDQLVSQKPYSQTPVEFDIGYYKYLQNNSNNFHEAGYDSFITGKIFIRLITNQARKEGINDLIWSDLYLSKVVQSCRNLVHVSRGTHRFLDLTLKELEFAAQPITELAPKSTSEPLIEATSEPILATTSEAIVEATSVTTAEP